MRSITKKTTLAATLMTGFVLGIACSHSCEEMFAEVRKPTPRLPVPSGALQSRAVLQQMASTLQSIDARLARIEGTVQKLSDRSDER